MTFPERDNETRIWLQQWAGGSLTIECGAYSYGKPQVFFTQGDRPRKLSIGRYCSFARDLNVYVGIHGKHPLTTFTTYPIGMAVTDSIRRTSSGGGYVNFDHGDTGKDLNVEIGHDVWVGVRCIIMAGVKIATGAVIGAGSLVNSDVPPYAIAVGSPARVIKHRHQPEAAAALLKSEWWRLDPDEIWRRVSSIADPYDMIETAAALSSP